MVCPYNGMLSAVKENGVLTHVTPGINLENMLNEKKPVKKTTFHLYEISKLGKSTDTENKAVAV